MKHFWWIALWLWFVGLVLYKMINLILFCMGNNENLVGYTLQFFSLHRSALLSSILLLETNIIINMRFIKVFHQLLKALVFVPSTNEHNITGLRCLRCVFLHSIPFHCKQFNWFNWFKWTTSCELHDISFLCAVNTHNKWWFGASVVVSSDSLAWCFIRDCALWLLKPAWMHQWQTRVTISPVLCCTSVRWEGKSDSIQETRSRQSYFEGWRRRITDLWSHSNVSDSRIQIVLSCWTIVHWSRVEWMNVCFEDVRNVYG